MFMKKKRSWTMADIEATGLKFNDSNATRGTVEPAPAPKKAKYGNIKKDGFDSIREYNYYRELRLREKAGEVTAIQLQVVFQLSVCKYKADFVYLDLRLNQWLVVDVKGVRTQVYILKKKMMLEELGITIIEV